MAKKQTGTIVPMSVLIIGASRGIGFEMVRQYRAAGCVVSATVRRKADMKKLEALGASVMLFDTVKSPTAPVGRAAAKADIVIYNAGVSGKRSKIGDAQSQSDFDHVMHANVLGPLRVSAVAAAKVAKRNGKLIFISSRMGSMGLMTNGGSVVYRASKAAVNAVAKAAALEFGPQGLTVLTLHPGWVRTDMGGKDADIDVATSVTGIRKVIAKATPKQNGSFFDYAGHKLAW